MQRKYRYRSIMVPTQINANSLLNANYNLYTESSFPLAFPAIPVGIDRERTSGLVYPATVVLNSFSPGREVSYACGTRE